MGIGAVTPLCVGEIESGSGQATLQVAEVGFGSDLDQAEDLGSGGCDHLDQRRDLSLGLVYLAPEFAIDPAIHLEVVFDVVADKGDLLCRLVGED